MATRARFTDRRVLVTGGGSGIGLGCAAAFAAEGAAVTICGRTESKLAAAAESIGPTCRYVVADIADEDAIRSAIEFAAGDEGVLHAVVANAGGTGAVGPLALVDSAAFQQDLQLNVVGTFLTIKHSAPVLARAGGGSIVAISSIAGCLTHRNMAPYSVAKAGLEMLVRNAADELGPWAIRVNAVRPGLVPSDASAPLAAHEPTRADYLSQMPLGRLGTNDDIAEAVLYFAGPDSTWVTGECLSVDGGHSLRRGPDLTELIGVHFAPALDGLLGEPGRPSG
jgi:NAD(P)-dependent dehydrogenase (short-subunit alcohol dehydrogenase family)